MTQRTGLRTIRELAHKMCKFIAVFAPIIRRVYPDSEALHIALDTAVAACAVLVEEADNNLALGD